MFGSEVGVSCDTNTRKAQLTLRTAKESSAKHVHFKDECGGPLVEVLGSPTISHRLTI